MDKTKISERKLDRKLKLKPFKKLKYDKVICFVGKDIKYGISTISILLSKSIDVIAIVGKTSKIVYEKITQELRKEKTISLISNNRFWEEQGYHNLYDKSTIGVSCGFDYIIPESILREHSVINIHPAALPKNRGCHHSFWGIMEKTIFGATIHWLDKGIDTGSIIDKKTFEDDGVMTASEIQEKSNRMCLELLSENIQNIMNGTAKSYPQGIGTYHSKKDILDASTLEYNDNVAVKNLYDLCRATCNKGNGFIISKDGEKFLIRIKKIEKIY